MSSELERRLEGMLASAPEPDPGAEEKALHRALRALRPVAAPRRGMRTAVLVFAGAVVLLVIAAGSLAAAGALHVSLGTKPKRPPVPKPLSLPHGANGIVAIVDGRLSVVTRGGFRIEGLTASAAALSPHAKYIAVGKGRSLVALAPNGRRAWSHPAGGTVVAIAWRPDGLQVAYIVRDGRRFSLHTIYGNGKRGTDTVIDRSVRAITPSWRADSLALAYVGAGGHEVVYDLAHKRHRVAGTAAPVEQVAFAPRGTALAVATPDSVLLGSKRLANGKVEAIGWFKGRLTAAVSGLASDRILVFAPNEALPTSYAAHGFVVAITPKLVMVRNGPKLFAGHTTLLAVPHNATVRDLQAG
jgi:hypothetical protein